MKYLPLGLTILTLIAYSAYTTAQVFTGNAQPVAAACAYNSSPPTVSTGNFVYVQCNSSGQLSIAP